MALVYADLHIHVGRTRQGKPVKISASPQLTPENILQTSRDQKGLQLIGLVDAACRGVLHDLKSLVNEGRVEPTLGGGLSWQGVTLLLGSEIEIAHTTGKAAHFLAFFSDLESLSHYARHLSSWVTNPFLSTQRLNMAADAWLQMVTDYGGVPLAAHAFTPHKGVYGNCVRKLGEMFKTPELIQGLELGLSADTNMASQVTDTHSYAYISNSDAHSLASIGREFTVYDLPAVNFEEWKNALKQNGKGIVANHGLEPLLGKYYRSFCAACQLMAEKEMPTFICPRCGRTMVFGVWDRLREISDSAGQAPSRPLYRAHVPLFMLPGVGPQTYERMIKKLGTEIEILYTVSLETIAHEVGLNLAKQIAAVRLGALPIQPGGGGKYGRITKV